MDAKDHGERAANKSSICSLEWIAWAMEAARRHKEAEHFNAAEGSVKNDPSVHVIRAIRSARR